MIESKRFIYAGDIGSTLHQKKKGGSTSGWARRNLDEGTKAIQGYSSSRELVERRLDIDDGDSVFPGFESPLFSGSGQFQRPKQKAIVSSLTKMVEQENGKIRD